MNRSIELIRLYCRYVPWVRMKDYLKQDVNLDNVADVFVQDTAN